MCHVSAPPPPILDLLLPLNLVSFFKRFLVDTCSSLGPLVPLFWISGDVSSGFQSQSAFWVICFFFCRGKCNIDSLRSISGATHFNLLGAGMQLVTSLNACAEVGVGSDSNGQSPGQKTNATIVPVTQLTFRRPPSPKFLDLLLPLSLQGGTC